MDYLHQMGRFLLISLFIHILFAYITTFVNPAKKLVSIPPIHVSLLERYFEDNDGLPSGVVVETDILSDVIREPSEAKLLAESGSTGGLQKKPIPGEPERVTDSVAKKKVQNKSMANAAPKPKKIHKDKTGNSIAISDVDAMARENPGGFYDSGDEAVVSLNTKKFEYAPYFLTIKRGIEDNWYYPSDAVIDGVGGNTLVRFTILPSGELESVAVISTSGEKTLDDASTDALRAASPFPPFPPRLKKGRIHIISNFSYQPSFSPVRSGR